VRPILPAKSLPKIHPRRRFALKSANKVGEVKNLPEFNLTFFR